MRLFVPLTKTEFDKLKELARIERRRPQDQAATILAKVLADDPAPTHSSHDLPTDDRPCLDSEEASRAVI